MQSGNLFMYTMHNPIMWLDPLGLFSWNEADDHWFSLRQEVRDAGGTMSWNGSTASVSIWGVAVNFALGNGVEMRNGLVHVRADAFYSTVVNAATEMVFLGGHGAISRGNTHAYHAMVVMFVSSDSGFHGTEHFRDNVRWGNVQYATIGGTSWDGPTGLTPGPAHLQSRVNFRADINLNTNRLMQHVHSGEGVVSRLLASHTYFYNNSRRVPYTFVPGNRHYHFNSNSFARGLLRSAGFVTFQIQFNQNLPGWQRPVPSRYFGV